VNRFQYSNHCGSKLHKENVFGNRDNLEQNPENDSKTVVDAEPELESQQNLSHDEVIGEDRVVDDVVTNKEEDVKDDEDSHLTDEYFDEHNDKMNIDDIEKDVSTNINDTDSKEEMKYVEVAVQLHICTVCDKKFHNKYMLARHLLTKFHSNRSLADKEGHNELVKKYHKCIVRLSPFQCSICRFYFNSNEDFVKHLNSEDHKENCEDLVGEIQCTLCHFKTHSREEIAEHFDSTEHVEKIGKRNKICIIKECHAGCVCKFCGLKMHSYERLQRHIKLKHADGKVVTGVLKREIGVRNRPKCAECNYQSSSISSLLIHMRRRHLAEKPYKCDICCRAFADKHSYKLHLKSALHNRNKLKFESNEAEKKESERTENEIKTRKDESDREEPKDLDNVRKETSGDEGDNSKSSQVQIDELDVRQEYFEGDNLHLVTDLDSSTGKEWGSRTTERKKRERRSRKKADPYGYSPKDKKSIKCNHCSFTVTDYDDLRPHYMKEHSAKIRICELCDTVFLSEKALKLHVLSKEHQANIELSGDTKTSTDQYFQCDVCKKKFTDEKYCKFHTAYQHFHSTTEQEVYKQNGYKSITREKFAGFLKTVENVGYKEQLQCPECDTVIKKNNLMVHLRNHTDERPFLCKICPNTFKSNYTLRKHLLKHFGCLERNCDICGKHFNKPSNYEEHMELHALQKANKEKSHICDVCGQAFYVEKQLAVHLRRHRTKDMKCDHPGCHWKFAFRHELNAHRRTHNNERKYLCDTCGFAAFEKYHLRRHEKIHKNERKFHCEYCTYKAGNRTHLKRHMRIHIGSKPFKCPYCSFACNTHENIRKHILETKKHEGLKVYPCKFCDFGTNVSKEFRGHLMSNHPKESDDGARQMPLSVFTGLFQKQEDIDKPAEGTKVLPCKERKIKKKPSGKLNEVSMADHDDWTGRNRPGVKKEKGKRKFETSDHVMENQEVHHAYDLSMKDRRMSFQQPDIVKNDFDQMTQPYSTGLVLQRQTPSPSSTYVTNISEPYQRYQGLVNAHIGVSASAQLGVNSALDLGIRHVQQGSQQVQNPVSGLPGQYHEQEFMKANQEEIMQYHDYSNKFGLSRNREDTESGNLVIDLNFQSHQ
jgi:KRAB domain-containing zinc finger protein